LFELHLAKSINHKAPYYSFHHSLVTSFLFGPDILVSSLLSHTLSTCSSLNIRDQVSRPPSLHSLLWGYFY
jgi:hypothetical protein